MDPKQLSGAFQARVAKPERFAEILTLLKKAFAIFKSCAVLGEEEIGLCGIYPKGRTNAPNKTQPNLANQRTHLTHR